MCIVDMHRLYRNIYNKAYTDIDILQFSDLLCKKLTVQSRRQNERLASLTGEQGYNASILERITDKDGNHKFCSYWQPNEARKKRWKVYTSKLFYLLQISYKRRRYQVQPDHFPVERLPNALVQKGWKWPYHRPELQLHRRTHKNYLWSCWMPWLRIVIFKLLKRTASAACQRTLSPQHVRRTANTGVMKS